MSMRNGYEYNFSNQEEKAVGDLVKDELSKIFPGVEFRVEVMAKGEKNEQVQPVF